MDNTAVYVMNRSTGRVYPSTIYSETGFRVNPYVEHLSVFVSMVYAFVDKTERTKMDLKGIKCLFLGYAEVAK